MGFKEQCKIARETRNKRTIEELSNSDNWVILQYLTENQTTRGDILDKISHCGVPIVREDVARDKRTYKKTLIRLANDPDETVAVIAIRNQTLEWKDLLPFLESKNSKVRQVAIKRIGCILTQLTKDKEER